MKISIAWVFDHINADYTKVDINHLIARFNQVVAEIEGFYKISINLDNLCVAQIKEILAEGVQAFSPEWGKQIRLPSLKSAQVGSWYVVKKNDIGFVWATMQDFGGEKDSILPAFEVSESGRQGDWKKTFEKIDYILELDNKSVTHRPDMWGHRGFAQEVAAMLDLPFRPLDEFIIKKEVTQFDTQAPATADCPIAISNQAPQICKRFAGLYFDSISWQASDLKMASRLARIDAKPIDLLVDATNYVMLDLGQPMHAYDASALIKKELVVRFAKNKEELTLLDGQKVALTRDDLVITNGATPMGLAGVMGGQSSGINPQTKSMLLESAWFDATTIRRTATRYKKRTEASARFEKTLDPNLNIDALERFLKLLDDCGAHYKASNQIFSLGEPAQPIEIAISHEFIQNRIGASISPEFVIKILSALGFGIKINAENEYIEDEYIINVPTSRSTKDVKIKEDIVEEIARFYGYSTLEPQLPLMQLAPADLHWVYQQRAIKKILAFACNAKEVANYAFFDEEFLQLAKWQPQPTLEVQSPVSENWRRLVTTLIPGLLKNVVTNSTAYDQLRFYELARVWALDSDTEHEKKSIAGIFFDKKSEISFYDAKADLQLLFDQLKLDVQWTKCQQSEHPWYAANQTAILMHNGTKIGIAGKVQPSFLHPLTLGDAFIFELDADYLINYQKPIAIYKPGSKFPDMDRDISILIAREIVAEQIAQLINGIDPKISQVTLLDFFEKDEWPDQKAMTFRFVISDTMRTGNKEEADVIWDKAAAALKQIGATIR